MHSIKYPIRRPPNILRSMLKVLFSRITITVLLIIAQLVLMMVVLHRFIDYSFIIQALFFAISFVMVVYLLQSNINPAYKLAWIVVIMAVPVIGGFIYLLIGGNQSKPYARRKMQQLTTNIENAISQTALINTEALYEMEKTDLRFANQARYLTKYTQLPPFQHTRTLYFPSGEALFDQMFVELEKAEHFIFMEYFTIKEGWLWDKILEILKRKAKEGVEVRLIYDDLGTIMHLPTNYRQKMESFGIRCTVFHPFHPILSTRFNNRSHRKITVIDGHTSFTGGANLADEYVNKEQPYGHWKDCGIMLYGDATNAFTLMFLSMWDYLTNENDDYIHYLRTRSENVISDGFVQPFSDSPLDEELVSESTFRNLIGQACKSVYIYTPYFVISNEMLTAIGNAAKRGVSVHIVTPFQPDSKWYVQSVGRASYERLIKDGVHIYEYLPGFVHSKVMLVDDRYALVGTINMDYRSMYLHFEDSVVLYDTSTLAAIKDDFTETIRNDCLNISLRLVQDVPWPIRVGRSILNVFAPLM